MNPYSNLAFWWLHYENLRDGWDELKRSGTALLEIVLAMCATASGLWIGWPLYHPYEPETFRALLSGAPAWFWGAIWVSQGIYQGCIAYFMCRGDCRCNRQQRRNAAAIGAAMWGFVAWILMCDAAPGWMTAIAPVFTVAQVGTFLLLLKRRRITD